MERQKNWNCRPDAGKMEALARMAGKIAHDFNNILGAIEGYATLASNALKEGEQMKEDMEEIRRSVAKATGFTKNMLAFSRRRTLNKAPCDVGALLAGLPGKAAGTARENIKIELDLKPGLPAINADGACLETALLNLLENAREAMPGGGVVTLGAEVVRPAPGEVGSLSPAEAGSEFVRISVADTGAGIPEENLGRLFEPLFTTREKGRGSGFGLPFVYGAVTHHNGWVAVSTASGKGSEFSIFLPVR